MSKIISHKTIQIGTGEIRPDFPNQFFDQILAFLGYGFCKCVWEEEWVDIKPSGMDSVFSIKLSALRPGDRIWAPTSKGKDDWVLVSNIFKKEEEIYKVSFENGLECHTSMEHKYLCEDGEKRPLWEVLEKELEVKTEKNSSKILSVVKMGKKNVVDLTVEDPLHCFYAGGVAVSNSHALSYSMYSAVELWLKAYYPLEFMCANLTVTPRAREKKDIPILDQRVRYCQSLGFQVYPPDVRFAGERWKIVGKNGLMAPLTNIKGFGVNDYAKVVENRPYSSFSEFCEKSGLGKAKIETLIFAGGLDHFGDREYLFNYFTEVVLAKPKKKKKAQMDFFNDETMEDSFEIKTTFSKTDLENMFSDLNGFSVQENILKRYCKLLEERKEVRTIKEVKEKKTPKHTNILCKIVGKDSFVSKTGSKFVKLTFSDGTDSLETVVQEMNWKRFSKTLKVGNILILPIQLTENGGFYLENLEKKAAQVLETE